MSERPPMVITVHGPTEHDIILGRSATAKNHPGNVLFRSIVAKNKPLYMSRTKRGEKNEVTQLVIDTVQQLGARFLAQTDDGKWSVADEKRIFEKVNQALREGQAVIKKQLQAAAFVQQQQQQQSNRGQNQQQSEILPNTTTSIGMNSYMQFQNNAPAPIAPATIAPAPVVTTSLGTAPTSTPAIVPLPQSQTFPMQQQPPSQSQHQGTSTPTSTTQEQLGHVLQEIQDIQSYQALNDALGLLQQRREQLEMQLQVKQERQMQQLTLLQPVSETSSPGISMDGSSYHQQQFDNDQIRPATDYPLDINRSHLTTDPDEDSDMVLEIRDDQLQHHLNNQNGMNEDLLQKIQAAASAQSGRTDEVPDIISSISSNPNMDPDLLRRSLLSIQQSASSRRSMDVDEPSPSSTSVNMDEGFLRNSIASLQSAAAADRYMEGNNVANNTNSDEDFARVSLLSNQSEAGRELNGNNVDNDSQLLYRLSILSNAMNQNNNQHNGETMNEQAPNQNLEQRASMLRRVSDSSFDDAILSRLTESQRMSLGINLRSTNESGNHDSTMSNHMNN